ncbi:MAG: RNA-binding protein [Anaerolineae bacterium]
MAEAIVMMGRASSHSRGLGFEETVGDTDGGDAVAQLDGRMPKGRLIRVSIARLRRESPGRYW